LAMGPDEPKAAAEPSAIAMPARAVAVLIATGAPPPDAREPGVLS
jgi:hypothetical protein